MNAIQFIKENGVEKAREVVGDAPDGATHLSDDTCHYVNANFKPLPAHIKEQLPELIVIDDLKRLVESVDLIGKYHSIDHAKNHYNNMREALNQYQYENKDIEDLSNELKQAIADYEAIYSDKEMGDDSHGDYTQMTLEQLQREHAELLLFNDELDRNCKAHKAKANKYQTKCWHIQTLLMNPVDKDMTLKAIKTVIERVGEDE